MFYSIVFGVGVVQIMAIFDWSKTNSLGGSPIETGPNDGNSTIDRVYDLSIKYMSGFNHN